MWKSSKVNVNRFFFPDLLYFIIVNRLLYLADMETYFFVCLSFELLKKWASLCSECIFGKELFICFNVRVFHGRLSSVSVFYPLLVLRMGCGI